MVSRQVAFVRLLPVIRWPLRKLSYISKALVPTSFGLSNSLRRMSTSISALDSSELWEKPSRYSLAPDIPIEEETLQYYKVEASYPVRLRQILKDRYGIIGKLGYGVNLTVWLARDQW